MKKYFIGLVTISVLVLLGVSCSKRSTQRAPVQKNNTNTLVNVNINNNTNKPLIGEIRDEHGCISSVGHTWCAPKQKCLKVGEEACDIASDQSDAPDTIGPYHKVSVENLMDLLKNNKSGQAKGSEGIIYNMNLVYSNDGPNLSNWDRKNTLNIFIVKYASKELAEKTYYAGSNEENRSSFYKPVIINGQPIYAPGQETRWLSSNTIIGIGLDSISKNGLIGGEQFEYYMPAIAYYLTKYTPTHTTDIQVKSINDLKINDKIGDFYLAGYLYNDFENVDASVPYKMVAEAIYDFYSSKNNRTWPVKVTLYQFLSKESAGKYFGIDIADKNADVEKRVIDGQNIWYSLKNDQLVGWVSGAYGVTVQPMYSIPDKGSYLTKDNPNYDSISKTWDTAQEKQYTLMLPIVETYLKEYSTH